MNNLLFSMQRDQFMLKHGGRESALAEMDEDGDGTGWWLFPDGARMSMSQFAELKEPPDDEMRRLKLIVKYRDEVLSRAEQSFNQLKLQVQATFDENFRRTFVGILYSRSQSEGIAELQEVQREVQKRRRELREVRSQLTALTGPTPEQVRAKAETDRRIAEQNQTFNDAVSKIKI